MHSFFAIEFFSLFYIKTFFYLSRGMKSTYIVSRYHLSFTTIHKYINFFPVDAIKQPYISYLNTIGGCWYFGRVLVPLRLKNQSLYHKILLLQKFNDTGGKVLKPKKNQPPTSEKKWGCVWLCLIVFDGSGLPGP